MAFVDTRQLGIFNIYTFCFGTRLWFALDPHWRKGGFSYQLLATKRWRLWALVIEAFQGFHLLPRISNILVWLWLHSMLTVLLYFKLIGRRHSRAVSLWQGLSVALRLGGEWKEKAWCVVGLMMNLTDLQNWNQICHVLRLCMWWHDFVMDGNPTRIQSVQ